MNTNNTPKELNSEFSLLLRCLGRYVMRTYPNKYKRQEFYDRYAKRHGAEKLAVLLDMINTEYSHFLNWSRSFSLSSSYVNLLKYFDQTPPNTPFNGQQDSLASLVNAPSPSADSVLYLPWWSELPNLAPDAKPANDQIAAAFDLTEKLWKAGKL
ncbi:hypothetical protein HMY34_19625 [Thiothrix subterranea]|uniref:hypothetical protein n=1 Tax=Thiothrix subterranea TaxID=2735563 RepID=UPI00192B6AC5|nr:hypothetical protein [Thiothrix subterranea]QQZ30785.1 hypothetical protein HMY34_19625 [Thiothrix subterranea]